MSKAGACKHPPASREKLDPEGIRVKCHKCQKVIRPRPSRDITHGTVQGYTKHSRVMSGEWDWPACTPCVQANTAYQKLLPVSDQAKSAKKIRDTARGRAIMRLLKRYPEDYSKFYAEEYALLREDEGAIAILEREVATLLRTGYGDKRRAEVAERDLRSAIKGKWATSEERARWARICALRARVEELRGAGEPRPGS